MPLSLTLVQVTDRTKVEPTQLKQLVKKLLIIIGRVARLLEIKDFDPEDFSSTIISDGLDKQQLLGLMSSSHMPYILNRLNVSLELEVQEGVCVCVCVGVCVCVCVSVCVCVCVSCLHVCLECITKKTSFFLFSYALCVHGSVFVKVCVYMHMCVVHMYVEGMCVWLSNNKYMYNNCT